ncbi:MAG: hypothetical protein A2144_10205 [Chloroflexi bacterium RBG_16_50_9]|nr:MAG: hypothetical protein A2144_10205 [Chloroflexi bacterium RBG_16_50_9]
MEIEKQLVDYISRARYEDLPVEITDLTKNFFLNILGSTIAGALMEGSETLANQVMDWNGKKEATILLYGSRVPAHNAAFIKSYMARALDVDDGIRPGMHVGAATVPAALAASELAAGCTGRDIITAVAVGAEVADRINLVSKYDGFDPTGVCSIFAASAAAGRILGLNFDQMWHALAIAFNKSGGSFQSNREGALSVRLIQGFAAQGGIISSQLAGKGFTGPKDFLQGVYGYFHLFARDKYDAQAVVGELGKRFEFSKTMFKKYPSCGSTIASTEAILDLVNEHADITPDNISHVHIKVTPYTYKIVGSPFQIGDNPRVNAQFNIQYCVANAILRKSSKLAHFEEPQIKEPEIMQIIKKIEVEADPDLDKRDETAVEMRVITSDGKEYHKNIDIAAGFPPRHLTSEELLERFWSCVDYAQKPLERKNVDKIVSLVRRLEDVRDIRSLIPLLVWPK